MGSGELVERERLAFHCSSYKSQHQEAPVSFISHLPTLSSKHKYPLTQLWCPKHTGHVCGGHVYLLRSLCLGQPPQLFY